MFPSLRQEGDPKLDIAGADLVIDKNLFFQFKMPDYLRTRGAIEIINEDLDRDFVPFYRFYIKNSDPSNQFNLLKKAANKPENIVIYISPMFITSKAENDEEAFYKFFRRTPEGSMDYICSIDFSEFINPHEIFLSNDDTHKICYSLDSVSAGYSYLFSTPKEIKSQKGLVEFKKQILSFEDNPNNQIDILTNLKNIQDILINNNGNTRMPNYTLEELQIELIIRYNIFWLPIARSITKRRIRVITKLDI